jgi:hypothetical protein
MTLAWFPVLTDPELDGVMILPHFCWAEDLRRAAADLR